MPRKIMARSSHRGTDRTDRSQEIPGGHPEEHSLRFLHRHRHLHGAFGNDLFAKAAEKFARFFGTPGFLIGQTLLVTAWIAMNVVGMAHFDAYPFILLNLAFSLQAAYAAPLILLAQTRQADRDKAHAEADAQHREALADASQERQALALSQSAQIVDLVQRNTELTTTVKELSQRIESLTTELHRQIVLLPSGEPRPPNPPSDR